MRILVSGAGIAGPSLARFLAPNIAGSSSVHITILEKQPQLLPHGQSIDLQGSARILIRKAGLDNAIRGKNTGEKGTVFINSRGKPCARFPLREDGSGVSMTSPYEILRGDLAMVLYDATKGFENVEYVFGTCINKVISNTDDEQVRVELSNGKVHDYDLLIAADGQWSKVRKQCFPDEMIQVVDKNMYGAYWTFPRVEGDDEYWNIYHALGARILSTRPDPYGTMRACFTIMPSDATVDAGRKTKMTQREEWKAASRNLDAQRDLVRRDFGDAGWQASRILKGMEDAPDFYFQDIAQIRMKKWHRGRVVCLGDAAYCPTSLTGMGTSLAILGAYVLAGELSKAIASEKDGKSGIAEKAPPSAVSISEALEAYDENFRPFVDEIQHIPSFIPGVAHPSGRLGRWALQTFLWLVGSTVQLPWFVAKSREGDWKEDFKLPKYPTLGSQYA